MLPTPEERLRRLLHEAQDAQDPIPALLALVELRTELEAAIRVQVGRGLRSGRSFGEIARALGISRQAAHRRFRALAPSARGDGRIVATKDAGRVLRAARDEAVRTDAAALGSDHVMIGILRSDGDAARSLQSHGIALHAARATVAAAKSQPVRPPEAGGPDAGVRRFLLAAGEVAAAQGRSEVDVATLLMTALSDPDGGARRIVTAAGASVPAIQARLVLGAGRGRSRTVRHLRPPAPRTPDGDLRLTGTD